MSSNKDLTDPKINGEEYPGFSSFIVSLAPLAGCLLISQLQRTTPWFEALVDLTFNFVVSYFFYIYEFVNIAYLQKNSQSSMPHVIN